MLLGNKGGEITELLQQNDDMKLKFSETFQDNENDNKIPITSPKRKLTK